MSDNPVRGVVEVVLCDCLYSFRFSWDALARLRVKYPSLEFDWEDPVTLADMVSAGIEGARQAGIDQQSMSAVDVMALSPPVEPCVSALQRALVYAYTGLEQPNHDPGQEGGSAEKKRFPTWWSRLFGQLAAVA